MMKKELKNCANCRCFEIEQLQNEFFVGLDTSKMICSTHEEEYNMLESQLLYYTQLMFNEEFKEVDNECNNCKSKFRATNSKKYFDKLNEVIKNKEVNKENKLFEVYNIENDYFKELSGF